MLSQLDYRISSLPRCVQGTAATGAFPKSISQFGDDSQRGCILLFSSELVVAGSSSIQTEALS